jgi:hypothetical protein
MAKIVTLFFSHTPSMRIAFPDGSEASFIGSRYATDDADKIALLKSEIAKGIPSIYQKPDMMEIDEKELDPMEALKRKIIADAIAAGEIQALTTSTSQQSPLKPASSSDLVDVKTPEELILAAGAETQPKPVDLSALLKKQ